VSGTGGVEWVLLDGPDALSYLDSQCTQDLAGLAVGSTAETLLLGPDGHVVAFAEAQRVAEETVLLAVPAGCADAVRARLERFAIRTAATFAVAGSGAGIAPAWADEEVRIRRAIPGAAELARGLVTHALDEALRERVVSFTKGCYPGQELVARMNARGATPPYVRRRCRFAIAPDVGDTVGDVEKDGQVTSVAREADSGTWIGLCVLHRTDAAQRDVTVHSAAGPLVAQLD
jgi:folate-binding protein YgfZ